MKSKEENLTDRCSIESFDLSCSLSLRVQLRKFEKKNPNIQKAMQFSPVSPHHKAKRR